MPMPTDPHTQETSEGLVNVLHDIFGPHPGFRPAHAKGVLTKGTFTPTPLAGQLSKAQHFTSPSTPIISRFSSSTGLPDIPDTDANGNPHGFAVRFQLATSPRRVHTDIVAHSTPYFPSRTGDEFLEFFQAVKGGKIAEYLETHPKAAEFVQAPKPTPKSLAKENFYGVNAIKLVDKDDKATYVRYRIVPEGGAEHFEDENELKGKSASFLFDEIPELVGGGKAIVLKLQAQVAEEGDVTDDGTVRWPETRKIVDLGTLKLDSLVEDDAEEQRKIIFDPVPRVEGVEPSDDPLLNVRAGVYLISGKERRAAK
ncbi:hypothetical protein IAT38_004827 [Cryptococcus sp. DSM 104549]